MPRTQPEPTKSWAGVCGGASVIAMAVVMGMGMGMLDGDDEAEGRVHRTRIG